MKAKNDNTTGNALSEAVRCERMPTIVIHEQLNNGTTNLKMAVPVVVKMCKTGRKSRRFHIFSQFGAIVGIFIGIFLGLYTSRLEVPCDGVPEVAQRAFAGSFISSSVLKEIVSVEDDFVDLDKKFLELDKNLVLVGIMTAKKFLNTRVVAAYHTWAGSIPGRVLFFSSEGSEDVAPDYLPVVGLKGVTDEYPPQKKSFLMLKYMHEYYRDKYEWFMRADDDVFIKGDKLAEFLHSINSSTPQFLGQAGLGKKEELGLLNLNENDNFCMGGPSMAFSRNTLKRIAPHINKCLGNIYSTHEDVEIGRCVRRYARVSCTWNYEMQTIFHHNHKEPNGSFTQMLKTHDIYSAVTLHPFKDHMYQYRMAAHMKHTHMQDLRHKAILLQREVNAIDELLQDRDAFFSPDRQGLPPGLMHFTPRELDEVLLWDFFTKSQFTHASVNPKPGFTLPLKNALEDIIRQMMELINVNERQRGRVIDFKDVLYGYHRVDPIHGAHYIIDMLLTYKRYRGKKITIPVRRHAYIQQVFTPLEFQESSITDDQPGEVTPNQRLHRRSQDQSGVFSRLQQYISLTSAPFDDDTHPARLRRITRLHQKRLVFIMPLAGRFDVLKNFMSNFEVVALQLEKHVELNIMLFKNSEDDQTADTINLIANFQEKYTQHILQIHHMGGPFSRGLGLERGSALYTPNTLLVFIDVDMRMNRNTLDRVRLNTIQGQQVYFPIVFSQFDPDTYCTTKTCQESLNSPFHFETDVGYWRQFGFGIAAMYNSDFRFIGGFDKTIRGWGMEDVKLYETYIAYNYSIFRAPDPGFVHIFHSILCDPNIEASQYQSCLGTKSQTYASIYRLADTIYSIPEILNRNAS